MRIWSPQAMDIMNMARDKASAMGHAEMDPLHLLWAFLQEAFQADGAQIDPGMEPVLAIRRTEQDLAGLPRAIKTVVASPNAAWRELILRAADLASAVGGRKDEGRIGPHELVLALVGDRGPAGDLLQSFQLRAVRVAG